MIIVNGHPGYLDIGVGAYWTGPLLILVSLSIGVIHPCKTTTLFSAFLVITFFESFLGGQRYAGRLYQGTIGQALIFKTNSFIVIREDKTHLFLNNGPGTNSFGYTSMEVNLGVGF